MYGHPEFKMLIITTLLRVVHIKNSLELVVHRCAPMYTKWIWHPEAYMRSFQSQKNKFPTSPNTPPVELIITIRVFYIILLAVGKLYIEREDAS